MTYAVFLDRDVHRSRTTLPGNVRQRVKRAIGGLANEPRPIDSESLDVTGLEVPGGVDIRRYRVGTWRLVYAVNDEDRWVWVLAVRRRPPYDYTDLADLVSKIAHEQE